MTSPLYDELMHLDPSGFAVIFDEVALVPFSKPSAWPILLEKRKREFGGGQIWRGSMYWTAELGQCGAITLFVSETDVYIERLYVDEFLRKSSGMRGFSYYLLGEIKKKWPKRRISFHDDPNSESLWKAVSKHGVIKKIEASDCGETCYEVVEDYS